MGAPPRAVHPTKTLKVNPQYNNYWKMNHIYLLSHLGPSNLGMIEAIEVIFCDYQLLIIKMLCPRAGHKECHFGLTTLTKHFAYY